ncbi:DUF29 domain-containing protein [Crocosphaera sp.]|uniref:DUF29 domain-containing protein n=1 Tax=Crocosphaera sp. TaxID=2729996 RepID=UPI0026114103|nr:DUF29 domain-containing protein [Crocosphaera sp.]MDJ0579722.1 DUF29 domain-containing protein [Crocosphaera sp.]
MLKHNIDTEYDSWLLEQAQLLRDRNFQHLDIDNLVEEIEALVRGEKSSVEQFAYLIMLHLLLIEYWYEESEWNRNHWEAEITGFRLQLNNKLTTNLRNHLAQRLDFLYSKAYQAAVKKTKSSINGDRFPQERKYSLEDIINDG